MAFDNWETCTQIHLPMQFHKNPVDPGEFLLLWIFSICGLFSWTVRYTLWYPRHVGCPKHYPLSPAATEDFCACKRHQSVTVMVLRCSVPENFLGFGRHYEFFFYQRSDWIELQLFVIYFQNLSDMSYETDGFCVAWTWASIFPKCLRGSKLDGRNIFSGRNIWKILF